MKSIAILAFALAGCVSLPATSPTTNDVRLVDVLTPPSSIDVCFVDPTAAEAICVSTASPPPPNLPQCSVMNDVYPCWRRTL